VQPFQGSFADCLHVPGCAPRPWAFGYNRFAVPEQIFAANEEFKPVVLLKCESPKGSEGQNPAIGGRSHLLALRAQLRGLFSHFSLDATESEIGPVPPSALGTSGHFHGENDHLRQNGTTAKSAIDPSQPGFGTIQ